MGTHKDFVHCNICHSSFLGEGATAALAHTDAEASLRAHHQRVHNRQELEASAARQVEISGGDVRRALKRLRREVNRRTRLGPDYRDSGAEAVITVLEGMVTK